jgi:GAF domain-containing protein
MISSTLSQSSQTLEQLDAAFATILPTLGDLLRCDRCFLYLRNPKTKFGKVTHCWRRNDSIPNIIDPDWKPEPESLPEDDPMFAAALRLEPSIFVEDVETENPQRLNRSFEQENFGHRSLIHTHLCQDGYLWGIFQPCIFDQPRIWSERDRALISEVEKKLTPMAVDYVKSATHVR